jgi:hypothetical protein
LQVWKNTSHAFVIFDLGTANVNLDLTQDDVLILRDVIRSYLSELHDEIVHTENFEFREGLQDRQRRLNDLLERLGGESS